MAKTKSKGVGRKVIEEKYSKKWLALLTILLVLDLIINFFYLNALYDISENNLKGELSTYHDPWDRSGCESDCYYGSYTYLNELNSCLESCCSNECSYERSLCLNAELSAEHCFEEQRRCNVDCADQYPQDYYDYGYG